MDLLSLVVVGATGKRRYVVNRAEFSGQFEVVGFLDHALPVGTTILC
jgi:hypothetical protein